MKVGWPLVWGHDWQLNWELEDVRAVKDDIETVDTGGFFPTNSDMEENNNTDVPDDQWIMTFAVRGLPDSDYADMTLDTYFGSLMRAIEMALATRLETR